MFKKCKKMLSAFLAVTILFGTIGTAPAMAYDIDATPPFPDEDADVPGYTIADNAPDLHKYKYFKMQVENGAVLAEATIGGAVEYKSSLVLDGERIVILEFLNEQTQEIRLELLDENHEYLGLIASGDAAGQWGIYNDPDNQWHDHDPDDYDQEHADIVNVANVVRWTGLYWDTVEQTFLLPG